MNKHLFRVIFNKSRGMRMVVQETASSGGGQASEGAAGPGAGARGFALKPVVAALAFLLGGHAGFAQIIPDRAAPGHQRRGSSPGCERTK